LFIAAHPTKKIAKKVQAKKVVKAKVPASATKEQVVVTDAAAVVAKVSKAKSPAKVVATPEKKKLSRTKTMAHTLKESKKILGDRRKMKKNRAVTPKAKRIAKKTAAKKPKAK